MTRAHISRDEGDVCLSSVCPEERDSIHGERQPAPARPPAAAAWEPVYPASHSHLTSPHLELEGLIFPPLSYI